jgi:hypothetical protein
MDCKCWGKHGWLLLHSTALCCDEKLKNNDENEDIKKIIKKFYTSVQYILPCIYCRRSFSQYIKELPIDSYLNKGKIFKWLYHIHNKVNKKLRDQGYGIEKDPSYESVYKKYKHHVKTRIGWNFIYCVAFNYPVNKCDLSTIRYNGHLSFFNTLGKLLCPLSLSEKYNTYLSKYPIENGMTTRAKFVKWCYGLETCIKGKEKCCTYRDKCKKFEKHRVEKCTQKTCRN